MKTIDRTSVALSMADTSARQNNLNALNVNGDIREQKFNKKMTLITWLEQIFSELIWKGV
ncbi:MAG: hypothetical protein COC05_05565 [Gammaproteobacteria bacterium]|nr:MAG: hypothetical protein COC05_05565 [Gammaproteobacteria bacterium]